MNKQDYDASNFQRILTMAEKAINRLVRRNYYRQSQWPDIIFQIKEAIDLIRSWIKIYKPFSDCKNYHLVLSLCLQELTEMINLLIDKCKPMNGKKQIKKSRKLKEQKQLNSAICEMLAKLRKMINKTGQNTNVFNSEFEKALLKAFEQNCLKPIRIDTAFIFSGRGDKTYVFPWSEPDTYPDFAADKDRFRSVIWDYLNAYTHETGHKKKCKCSKNYKLCGFRSKPRKTIMRCGKREFPIRMIQCKDCSVKFSLIPSFLPREKNFGIEIIGNVIESMLRFSTSIQGVLRNLKTLLPTGVKSKQTILNWIRYMGTLHPAVILTRAGIIGSGYLQEDEGFEKEPQLRTYSIVMADPEYLLIWHSDYTDHVDEKTLRGSLEGFIKKINFKILGVTKDKWEPSTKALKAVFRNIRIGFCHRHYLKKLYADLQKYQKSAGCSGKVISRLYKKRTLGYKTC